MLLDAGLWSVRARLSRRMCPRPGRRGHRRRLSLSGHAAGAGLLPHPEERVGVDVHRYARGRTCDAVALTGALEQKLIKKNEYCTLIILDMLRLN